MYLSEANARFGKRHEINTANLLRPNSVNTKIEQEVDENVAATNQAHVV